MLFERPILTAAEMRAAERRAIDAGTSAETLMERAGAVAAEAIWRFAGPLPALVLCGPGNNGGDGYVVARLLRERAIDARVAAMGEPRTAAAQAARARWDGPTVPLLEASGRPLLVDALFGTGLKRGLDEPVREHLHALAREARVRVALDLPSGVATDDGAVLSAVPDFDLTVTFAAPKPAHFLQPAARHVGRLAIGDIGIETGSRLHLIGRPILSQPGPADHKYNRGYAAVVAGEMPGASALAASAAARAGAGYVRLLAETTVAGTPQAIVQGGADLDALLADDRVGCIAAGPGLGRSERAAGLLGRLLDASRPLVLDADALVLLGSPDRLRRLARPAILTPHSGEFERLFGGLPGGKLDQARAASDASRCVVLLKGPDTVVAGPDGRAAILSPAPAWLATAGTGDVLTGIIAAMRAQGLEPFEAACAGAWLHRRAAELAGPYLVADDLVAALPAVLAEGL